MLLLVCALAVFAFALLPFAWLPFAEPLWVAQPSAEQHFCLAKLPELRSGHFRGAKVTQRKFKFKFKLAWSKPANFREAKGRVRSGNR